MKITTTYFSKYFKNDFKRSKFDLKDRYIMTCDLEQREWKELGDTGVVLKIETKYNPDNRDTRPTIGRIVWASEGSQFKVGQRAICRHFTFQDSDGESQHLAVDDSGNKLFEVDNYNIVFGIDERSGELEPREGVLICEPVYGKFAHSSLDLSPDYEGRRRDIARVKKVWEGCTDFKAGQYVMLKLGGDYEFEHNGEKLIRVDIQNEDAYAVVESDEWYDSVMRKAKVDRELSSTKISKQSGKKY